MTKDVYNLNVVRHGKEIAGIIDEFYGNYEDDIDRPTEGAFEMAKELLELRNQLAEYARLANKIIELGILNPPT